MNTAFHDALNLSWKLHHVESGFADRSILQSYETERKAIAEDLLNFDAKYAALFSKRMPSSNEISAAASSSKVDASEANEFVQVFKSSQEFTSGYGIAYGPNVFNWTPSHPAQSPLFKQKRTTLRTGRVMPPANVTRIVDANIVHLEQAIPFNGSFRLFHFAGHPGRAALIDFATALSRKSSFYRAYERRDIATVSYHERHNPHSRFFTICTIYAASHSQIEISKLPHLLARYSHHVYADDVRDARQPQAKAAAHAKMGLDAQKGGVVVVRPDGHVGCVVQLVEGSGTVDALDEYFGAFVTKAVGRWGRDGGRLAQL